MLLKTVPARILAQLKAKAPATQHPWIHCRDLAHISQENLMPRQGQDKDSEEEQTKKAFWGLLMQHFLSQTEFLEKGPP